ncbi:hypothetical protein F5Y10DRAFT_173660 [Nemania abortiva]|nr:hypothetical protein F5Y10DRAFT_173660 [Nemania abortiva]
MADSGANVSPATYDLIQTWIGQQQQMPTPLTDKLRSALVGLEYALKAEAVSLVEPEMENQNWVGMLQEYRAAYPFNGSIEVDFTESSWDPTGRGPIRWKCQVTIGEAPGAAFPHGDANQPSFARKRDAKKYAAKCAIDWLRAKSFMPQDGVRFPKGVMTAHHHMQRQRQQQQAAQSKLQQLNAVGTGILGARGGQGQAPATPSQTKPSPSPAVPNSPFDASQPSLTNQVQELCRELNYPVPIYRIQAMADGFFNGWPDFGDHADLLPPEVSKLIRVTDMISKSAAKETIAEQLLVPLRAEKQRRDAENQALLAQYNNDAMKE